jgi:hypothetical protein
MPAGKQRDEQLLNDGMLPDDHLANLLPHPIDDFGKALDSLHIAHGSAPRH